MGEPLILLSFRRSTTSLRSKLTSRITNSVFFLYFSGRLNATQTLLQPALSAYYLAIQAQREYIQLQHICHWFVLIFLSLPCLDSSI